MSGGKQKHSLGYTIVEVMIVLAVSGVMFVIAATFVSGKQERSTFTSGVNGTASRLQDVIEQITDGKFSDVSINCSPGPSFAAPAGQRQGTNQSCMYLGKVLHFKGGSNLADYETFTIAGNRLDMSTQKLITSMAQAVPTAVISPVDLTTQETVPQNLSATVYQGTAGASGGRIYDFGFMQGVGTDNGGGTITSGTQTISLYYAPTVANNMTEAAAAGAMKGNLVPTGSVSVCLTDNAQTAKLVVGSNGNQLSIDTQWEGHTNVCT